MRFCVVRLRLPNLAALERLCRSGADVAVATAGAHGLQVKTVAAARASRPIKEHAREWATPLVTLEFAERLPANPTTDPLTVGIELGRLGR